MDVKEGNRKRDGISESAGEGFLLLEKEMDNGMSDHAPTEFDNWVADFGGCEFPESTVHGKNGGGGPLATVPEPLENVDGATVGIRRKWIAPLCLLSVFLAAIMGAAWVGFLDTYSAETKLLFVSPHLASPHKGSWNVEQEAELLKSSALAHRVLGAGFGQHKDSPDVRYFADLATVSSDAEMGSAVGNADELLAKLSFQVAHWDGGGYVTITVQGDDPQYLKLVLNSYIRKYLQSRHELVNLTTISRGPTGAGAQFSGNQGFISTLDGELARMELMKRNCELALILMEKKTDKKKGSLAGFLPSGLGSELRSLNRINDELVNLSIKRQHLAIRFNPASREISEVNQEIDGLRKMLGRHLRQQVTFLQSGIEQLEARKQEIQRQVRSASRDCEPRERKPFLSDCLAPGEWIPVSSDVVVMPGQPIVVKRPIRERFMILVSRSVDSLFKRRNKSSPNDCPKEDASRLACTTNAPESGRNGQQIEPETWSQDCAKKHDLSAEANK